MAAKDDSSAADDGSTAETDHLIRGGTNAVDLGPSALLELLEGCESEASEVSVDSYGEPRDSEKAAQEQCLVQVYRCERYCSLCWPCLCRMMPILRKEARRCCLRRGTGWSLCRPEPNRLLAKGRQLMHSALHSCPMDFPVRTWYCTWLWYDAT